MHARKSGACGGGINIATKARNMVGGSFGGLRCRYRGRRSLLAKLARTCRKFHWHGRANRHAKIPWQAQHFCKVECKFCGTRVVKYRFRGRRDSFEVRAGFRGSKVAQRCHKVNVDFVASAALLQGRVQTSWQDRRGTFERSRTCLIAGAVLSEDRCAARRTDP